jgi:hypothetical protein
LHGPIPAHCAGFALWNCLDQRQKQQQFLVFDKNGTLIEQVDKAFRRRLATVQLG